MTIQSGSQLCGAASDRIDGQLRPVIACHSAECRKASGHHVAASPVARRGFFATCESNLFREGSGATLANVARRLDGDAGVRLTGLIRDADKGNDHDIADGRPQARQDDPVLTTRVIQ